MEERLLIVERRLKDTERTLSQLATQLAGDGSVVAPGVVGILASHTDALSGQGNRLNRLERAIDRMRWTLAGASSVGGLMGGGLVFLIRELIVG